MTKSINGMYKYYLNYMSEFLYIKILHCNFINQIKHLKKINEYINL